MQERITDAHGCIVAAFHEADQAFACIKADGYGSSADGPPFDGPLDDPHEISEALRAAMCALRRAYKRMLQSGYEPPPSIVGDAAYQGFLLEIAEDRGWPDDE
jgi:hypothetical protein